MSNSLEILAKNRDALLLAEIAAWLHMFGKFHEEFLQGDHEMDTKIPDDIPIDFNSLLKDSSWTGSVWNRLPVKKDSRTKNLSISDVIRRHRPLKDNELFIQFIADAHGRGSGIEKGVLERFASKQQIIVYISTALGFDITPEIDLIKVKNRRDGLYIFLKEMLNEIKLKNANFAGEWNDFHDKFIRRLREDFSTSVAETRRPLNDVTLLDQTSITVAFFKAALAQICLQKEWTKPYQKDEYREIEKAYHWRLLRVGLDGYAFWGNSTSIGDLLARKKRIYLALDEVKKLLEISFPLGAEVYRDENGSVFIVPDIHDLLTYSIGTQSLEMIIQTIAERFFEHEASFVLSVSEKTRDILSFGETATKNLPPPMPVLNWLESEWLGNEKDICPVCGVRPQGPYRKALERKVCRVCEQRRTGRTKEWVDDLSQTMWIDEVADTTGKIALLVAQFNIGSWLSGQMLNTVLTLDPKKGEISYKNRGKYLSYEFNLEQLAKEIEQGLAEQLGFGNGLLDYLVLENSRAGAKKVEDFYKFMVTDTDLKVSSSPENAHLLALAMLRLPPSFARIRRVWETTQNFWQEIQSLALQEEISALPTRLSIEGQVTYKSSERDTIQPFHAYEIKVGNINLSLVCKEQGQFLTVDNLQRACMLLSFAPDEAKSDYAASSAYIKGILEDKEFDIGLPTGYGSPNKVLGKLRVTKVEEEATPYIPAIPILAEPSSFMMIVPADKALQVANKIKEKYETEIGKVRNRLPLTLGIVFADTRMPLPAILESGRRMLKQPTDEQSWKVTQIEPLQSQADTTVWPDKVVLTLKRGQHSLPITVPTVMGGDKTHDVWYPYWKVIADKEGAAPSGRSRQFKGVDGHIWVHACDLQEGDEVEFMPSRFDFEYLDTAARRFEISYADDMRRALRHLATRPYYLEELSDLKVLGNLIQNQKVAVSQIMNMVGIIEAKRAAWGIDINDPRQSGEKETFQQFVHDVIHRAYSQKSLETEQLESLCQAAVHGQLADVVDLYMRILDTKRSSSK